MDHLTDNILTQLASGEADTHDHGQKPDDVREHLASCPACRGRLEEYRRLWTLMGGWSVQAPPSDGFDLPNLPPQEAGPGREPTFVLARLGPWRAAAAIALAAGLGFMAAVVTGPKAQPINAQTVAQTSLVLPQFQNASPGMFAQSILGFARATEESPEHAPKD